MEKKICLAKGDLKLQTGAILRIRQLLKESSQNSDDPYHSFLRQCLKQTRGFGAKLEYLMSKLRLTARCLRDSNGETFTSMAGPVHVGGVIRTGGRRKVRRCDGEVRMSCGVTRGEVTSLVLVVRHLAVVLSLLRVKEVVQAVVVLGGVEEVEAMIEAKARVRAKALRVVVHVVRVEASLALWAAL